MEATQLPRAPRPLTPGDGLPLSGKSAGILLGCIGLLIALVFAGAPLYLLAVPAVIAGVMACIARPVEAVVGTFLLGGFIGSIIAFTGLPVDAMAATGLLCLWLAVLGMYVSGRARARLWLLPALLPLLLYVFVTAVQMFTSESLTYAFADFRITAWYMLAVVLLAVAPWESRTFRRIALGMAAVALLVGLYALYRYVVGPSAEEFAQARASVQRAAASVPTRFFGSFLSAFQLAAWCGTAIPFLVATAFVAGRRWRLVAMAAAALCAFAVFASDVRTGLVATIVGTAVVMGLFMLSRAFVAQRIAATFFAVLGLAAVGIGGYAVVVAGDEASSERFSNILDPAEDFAFQERLTRWEEAVEVVEDEPLGHGLGTQGHVGQNQNPEGQVGPFNLDSAYLKVGIQQGWFVMLLFAAAQLALLVGIAHRAVLTRDRWRCALGIGACGALVTQMILFFNGIYSEGVTALSAWIIIGIGVAQFTSPERLGSDAPEARPAK